MEETITVEKTAPKPEQNKTLMGVLCYLSVLLIIPFMMAKDDPFVRFHLKQGIVLFVLEIGAWVLLGMFMWHMYGLMNIAQLAGLVFSIIGIVNVVQGHEKELPFIGQLSKHVTF